MVADFVGEVRMWRITMTVSALNAARNTAFLVAGTEKAEVLRDVIQGAPDPEHLPAQLIQPLNGSLLWLVDQPAAALVR